MDYWLKLHTINNKIIIQFEHLFLHDHHIPGVGSAVEDGLPVETAYNIKQQFEHLQDIQSK